MVDLELRMGLEQALEAQSTPRVEEGLVDMEAVRKEGIVVAGRMLAAGHTAGSHRVVRMT
jgi:hypothetical protein